jgi:hypothetical protein
MKIKCEVSFEYRVAGHIYNGDSEVYLLMKVKFKKPNSLFPTCLYANVVYGLNRNSYEFEQFYQECLSFINDDEKIASRVIRLLKEEFSKDKEKKLIELINSKKISFEVKVVDGEITEIKKEK